MFFLEGMTEIEIGEYLKLFCLKGSELIWLKRYVK